MQPCVGPARLQPRRTNTRGTRADGTVTSAALSRVHAALASTQDIPLKGAHGELHASAKGSTSPEGGTRCGKGAAALLHPPQLLRRSRRTHSRASLSVAHASTLTTRRHQRVRLCAADVFDPPPRPCALDTPPTPTLAVRCAQWARPWKYTLTTSNTPSQTAAVSTDPSNAPLHNNSLNLGSCSTMKSAARARSRSLCTCTPTRPACKKGAGRLLVSPPGLCTMRRARGTQQKKCKKS